jgi:hypothetical protein
MLDVMRSVENYGLKVISIPMRKNTKTCCETRKKRALAIDKNLLFGNRSSRTNRVYYQVIVCGAVAFAPDGMKQAESHFLP